MARFNFSAKIRIGAKLGLSLGLGVVMVAGTQDDGFSAGNRLSPLDGWVLEVS